MKSIAIITARGGSKRIPRKNIKEFLGKPIIAYTIEAAIASNMFDQVMVSTDDDEIAEIAKKYGAQVPFMRSDKTSNDFATTADVLNEVIDEYKKLGESFEYMCCLYPTAPFVTPDAIGQAMKILEDNGADTVLPVVKFSFPPQRGVIMKDGYLTPKYPECMPMRSQDLEPMYHDAGQFYCMKVSSFVEQGRVVMDKTMPYMQDDMNVQDIDTPEDWAIAEVKYKVLHNI